MPNWNALDFVKEEEFKKFLAKKEELTIGDDEKYVCNFAYADYVNLKKVTLGTSVREIRNGAFWNCTRLREIDTKRNKNFVMEGDCLVHRRKRRLALCLGEPRIPDDILELDLTCFLKEGEVENFHVGKSVRSIDRALRKFNIKSISLDPENTAFELEGNCLIRREDGVIVLGCENSVIPTRATGIDCEAFCNCAVKKVHIPENITSIESGAFSGCGKLEEVTFDNGIGRIEDGAFQNCTALRGVQLPNSITFINTHAFDGCKGLTELPALGALDEITDYAFSGCGFTSVTIPDTIGCIGEGAFCGCENLASLDLGGVEFLDERAFADCTRLETVTMCDELEEIRPGAFSGCAALCKIKLSAAVREIYPDVFSGCTSLAEVDLPERVTIWNDAFAGCTSLAHIDLSRVKEVKENAFRNCSKLEKSGRNGGASGKDE